MKRSLENSNPIFVSLQDLLSKEHSAQGFSFLAKKQKVRSVLGGKHASKLRGRGLDFEEVRNYVAGDDIRNIDWKVTARTQKTHSRVYSEEKEKPTLIVVDQSKSMFFGTQNKMKSVVAAELAALTAFRILKEGDRVGGVVFADNGIDIISPKRNRKNILRFFEHIVQRNHELLDSTPVNHAEASSVVFKKIRNIVTHDFLIVVISDFRRYSKDVIKNIAQMAQNNDVILAKVFDPMERDIPKTKMVIGDTKKQLNVDGKNRSIQQEFSEGFDTDFQNFENEMKKHRIPVLKFDTVQPVDDQLKNMLSSKK
ncbi:DUF58 domain-containing protein [Urechidicola vernalis]|uniref:DUF58 domain-containing protein n=1 Tax=Urechidicola vernalis TaxID=3075600 RepID=A0ABU2Y5Y1_9FLAO|nr:DUF58 domain-containing protein [Urechidicola sp. P050]MDT0553452.1 DUF58 domain-containing protein [Urechidicola sp. P050]